jgi:two-component system, NtrC family, response regulator HydG
VNANDTKLLEFLRFDEAAGTIHWKHRRMLLFDADATGLLRKELIETLGLERAKRILTRFGYACGYRDALTSKELFHWKNDQELWEYGPWLHTQEGIVRVRVLRSKIDKPHGVFEVEVEWLNSYEAEQHQIHVGPSDCPVCWTLTGYASGHSSAVFGRPVFYYEKECVGKGDRRCLVVAKKGDDTSEEVRALKVLYQIDDIETEWTRLLESLEQHARELEQERAKISSLETQIAYLREAVVQGSDKNEIVGKDPKLRRIMSDVDRVAPTNTTVIICGETGTGKELIARAIHTGSKRKEQPLVTVNCAALPHGLVESELFGHEKGAFTGALQRKLGRFEIANGGTVFLDEVGELPLETQAKLLRVLQEGEFERLGGIQTIHVDVRVLAATNRELRKLVVEGKFRDDLYYRLNVFTIQVPPLRERPDDIGLLTNYFVQKFRTEFGKDISHIDTESIERLKRYSWPGNIRELEHIIERAVLISDDHVLTIDLPLNSVVDASVVASDTDNDKGRTLADMERSHITAILRHTRGLVAGKGGAAEILGLPASTLRNRMKKLGVRASK